VLVRQFVLLRRSDVVRIQSELVNIEQQPGESVLKYVDRVESLWQELDGTSLTVPEPFAVDHMRRGLSPEHGPLFALFASSAVDSFEDVRDIVLRNKDARVSRQAAGRVSDSDVLQQLQQLQLQHAQLQSRREKKKDLVPRCKQCKRHHRGECRNRKQPPVGRLQHTIGNAEASTVEISSSEVCNVQGGIRLSICADSGATNVVTPDRAAISNYTAFPPGQGHVRLADKNSGSRAEGFGTLALRSKSTGSTLTFTNVLYMLSARRTLVCLSKSMKSGVFSGISTVQMVGTSRFSVRVTGEI
jgi:hypothetical protein